MGMPLSKPTDTPPQNSWILFGELTGMQLCSEQIGFGYFFN